MKSTQLRPPLLPRLTARRKGKDNRFRGALAVLIAICAHTTLTALGQGSFQNLDFESANAGGLTNLYVAISDAFPGWSGYIGTSTNPVAVAGYNFVSGGSALITLITPTAPPQYGNAVIRG